MRRLLSLPPDPIGLARALARAGLDHVALLHGRDRAWLAAAPDRESHALDPMGDEPPDPADEAPRWIGVIPYEARRSLEREVWRPEEQRPPPSFSRVAWLRYPAVIEVGRQVVLHARDQARGRALERALDATIQAPGGVDVTVGEADAAEAHLARVRAAIELIRAGDLYQVNLARRLDVAVEGDPLDVYARLHAAAPSSFAAALSTSQGWVLSTSPELLLRVMVEAGRMTRLVTEPIKGTRPRGGSPLEDERLARELAADPKERAELAMIVDVERNDLGSVCDEVSIDRLPAVTTHPTVHHRSATLSGRPRAEVTREEVLSRMVPSGSVTGAPKIRAMEVIAGLEAHRRGLYTGGFGYLGGDGSVVLAMAIRTLTLKAGRGDYFTGGGIVVDSDPERELEETRWKAAQLTAMVRPR